MSIKPQIGVDEVGRGPIAGPVAVGAFIYLNKNAPRLFAGVKESKQLTETQREMWFARILQAQKNRRVDFRVTFKSEKVIDQKGLSYAIKSALASSLEKLQFSLSVPQSLLNEFASNIGLARGGGLTKNTKINPGALLILLDGGLKAPAIYVNQRTIIRGDEKKKIIALASICAKVLRDRKMNALAIKYPKYGFQKHKGYGTRAHYQAIKKYGLLKIHRRSFLSAH